MLEVRYNTNTKELSGWWSSSKLGNHEAKLKNKPDYAIALLDIPIPDKPLEAWLYNGRKLVPNPNYIEHIPRNYGTEIDDIKTRLDRARL